LKNIGSDKVQASRKVRGRQNIGTCTRGTVSSLLFFPLKLMLHKVYISNILCGPGYEFKTPIVKEAFH